MRYYALLKSLPFVLLGFTLPTLTAQDMPRDPAQPVEARVADLLAKLTADEKITLIAGKNYLHTQEIARLGIPSLAMTDGPFGVRYVPGNGGRAKPTRVYAGGMALAASWDADLARTCGISLGRDCRALGIHILLGPGMNLYRAPFCGRNYEYFGEDPLLSGTMAVGYIQGVQSQGVAATMKHYVANEQEFNRYHLSSEVEERALRELYLKPFEMAVKSGAVGCAMDSYNPVNGIHTTESDLLNNQVLKTEWGFQGLLMSDWRAVVSTEASANGGLDLEMPGPPKFFNKEKLQPLIDSGKVTQATIDDKVRRLLRVMITMGWLDRPQLDSALSLDDTQGDQVALEGAREGIVLLKNQDRLLPIDVTQVKKIVVLGHNADPAVAVGGGSAHADYRRSVSVLQGLKDVAGAGVQVLRIPWNATGPDGSSATAYGVDTLPDLPPEAIPDIQSADLAVICVGFNDNVPDYWKTSHSRPEAEGEAMDRTCSLPPGQVKMIQAVRKLNPRTVVVMNAGGSVETKSWIDAVPAFLDAFYPGQAGGEAFAEIIFGKTNPSGKLPFSWEKTWEESSAFGNFPTKEAPAANTYKEGVLLGYRWLDTKKIEPLFPFGFGLSYTTYAYANLTLTPTGTAGDATATFTVQNTGKVDGAEITQLYVAPPSAPVVRAVHELKGFTRTVLKAGETKTVTIPLTRQDLAYWDTAGKKWTVTPGNYDIQIGGSSRDLPLHAPLTEQ